MKAFAVVGSLLLGLVLGTTASAQTATMTFNVNFNGYAWTNGSFQTITTQPISDTVTVQIPLFKRDIQAYSDSYAEHWVMNLGKSEPSAGLVISTTKMADIFANETFMPNRMAELGYTVSGVPNGYPRDYAFIGKRDVHVVPESQRYLTWMDATLENRQELAGPEHAILTTMTRFGFADWGPTGDMNPFAESDVPGMLLSQNAKGSFNFSFDKWLDPYSVDSQGNFAGWLPFESRSILTYSGQANLSSFTIDGVNMMPSAVPEPETYAMMLAGLGLMGAVARRRKAKQA